MTIDGEYPAPHVLSTLGTLAHVRQQVEQKVKSLTTCPIDHVVAIMRQAQILEI